jgi:phospholipid/cholesterol/gamma-HCH transport system substrate-binding protein
LSLASYDPAIGNYIGPDGNRYTQADLAHPGNKTWQSMLVPPAP